MTASKKTVRTRRGVEPTGRPARREVERGRRARTNSSRTFAQRCRVLARDRERVDLVAVVVLEKWVPGTSDSRLEHAEAERDERAATLFVSVLRARDDVVPRWREEGRDLVFDRAMRLVVGRQERAHLGVGGEAVAQELDGTRLRD